MNIKSSSYFIPSYLVKPLELPKPFLTSEKDTFAYVTFRERIPLILDEIITLNNYSQSINNKLLDLRDEIASGTIKPLYEDTPDKDFWNSLSKEYIDSSWFDVPWLWAECFFYRRILEATKYFQKGTYHLVDPFIPKKQAELQPEAAPSHVANLLENLPTDPALQFKVLIYASLWGNRFDLSHNKAAQLGHTKKSDREQNENILINDSKKVWDFLKKEHCKHIAFVADNTGYELLLDFVLLDFLLNKKIVSSIDLHVKPQPMFVSDATPTDINLALDALHKKGGKALSLHNSIRKHLNNGTLNVMSHWFYPTSFCFYQMPNDLLQTFTSIDFIFFKGDANYRRLVGDLHWLPNSSFQNIIRYLPIPNVALRTLKSDVIVGLTEGKHEALRKRNSENLVNGHYGVIQATI